MLAKASSKERGGSSSVLSIAAKWNSFKNTVLKYSVFDSFKIF